MLTLSVLTFLFTLRRCQVKSMKSSKRKVRKYLKCVKEFSRRFNMANEKYLSIFLGGSAGGSGRGGELHQIKRSRDKTEIGKK